ncbi:MAG TPA: prolipoprotein diacylglyceryl transferase family protein [Symbiobacteriaceae bacterium]|nr:prolipoprotein diacylglyceryl transferase family protein [Symbiobacteriaceae bacterium]
MPFLPDVIMVGQLPLATVALTGLLGGMLAYWLVGLVARGAGAAPAEVSAAQDIVPGLVVGGILGAKLIYVLLDLRGFIANPGLLIVFPHGPLVVPAGLAGGLAVLAWGLWRRPDWRRLLDFAAASLAAGLAVALAGWKAPGSWAFAPLVGIAAATALATRADALRTAIWVAGALALADQARPAGATSPLQVTAALVGTAAWYLLQRQMKKDSGA